MTSFLEKIKTKNHWLRKTVGIFFIFIGIIMLFLPFTPGLLFIFIGLVMLELGFLKKIIEKIKARFKK